MKSEDYCFLVEKQWKSRQYVVEKQRHHSADKGLYSQGYGLPSGHIQLWELDYKGGRTSKNWCLWTVVLEKTPESPLDSKVIKPVNLKGDQPWIFTGKTDVEAEVPVFWSSDANRRLIAKVPDAEKDWGQKEKRASENEMARWHHWCNEDELGPLQEMVRDRTAWWAAVHGVRHDWVTEQQKSRLHKSKIAPFLPWTL